MLKIKIKLHSNQFTAVLLSMVISLSPPSTGDYFFIIMIHSEILISGERTLDSKKLINIICAIRSHTKISALTKKQYCMIWQTLGHIWHICGNDMERLGDHMELIWDQGFPNFKLRKV